MSGADNRPVDKSSELGNDSLNPRLEDGDLGLLAVDSDRLDAGVAQVGLVEHEGVAVQAEEVTKGLCALGREKVSESTSASRGVDPLLRGAGWGVAVVVDAGRPARVDLDAVEAVAGDLGEVRPHGVLGVEQGRPGVVADAVGDAVVGPGAEGVAVVQTGDGWRDDAVGGEPLGGSESNLSEPGLVEGDLLVDIRVGGVVLLQVGEGVRDVGVVVEMLLEPDEQRVRVRASSRPGVVGRGRGPEICSSAQGLLELELSVRGRVVFDGTTAAGVLTSRLDSSLDVAVTVVADLDEVGTASVELGPDGWEPAGDAVHIGSANAEDLASRLVDVRLEEHVVDLGVQVDSAVSCIQAAGDPGNPCVLQVVGGLTPDGVEADEEDHLLASVEVVDDRCSRLAADPAASSKRGDLLGGVGVADGGRVVPQSLRAHARVGTGAQSSSREVAGVGEVDKLLNAISTAAAVADRRGAEFGAGEDIVLHHAHAVRELVGIQLVPLVVRQGATPAVTAIVVADFAGDDDAAKVSTRRGVQSGELDTGLGDEQRRVGDAVAIEAGGGDIGLGRVASKDQDVGSKGASSRRNGACTD